ncbi:MAG: hypothetical protein LBQ81_01295 [Zoogloeaceae bacterium]|nr:hypothetical protein [Zoogloeaceae bacterium]
MKSSAIGQLYGYALQFPRALLRLLEAGDGAKVMIEELGDVAVCESDGSITSEEDKSSLVGNALTDLSTNLWKTFNNWIDAINAGELVADRDRFILYTNHIVSENSLVKEFSHSTETTVDKTIEKAQKVLDRINETHALHQYKDKILKQNITIFRTMLPRFELVEDRKADDVYPAIRHFLESMMLVPDGDVKWVLDEITGWLQNTIMQRVATQQCACVSRAEFVIHVQPILGRVRRGELIDYAVSRIPNHDELSRRAGEHPVYVRQLRQIKLGDEQILNAVSDYFRADTNRLEWIDKGLLSESDMLDFENKLLSFHGNERSNIELTESSRTEEIRGQLLLNRCQQRQQTISGQEPPDRTVQGSYHVLSDERRLGWHPHWEDAFKTQIEGGDNGEAR